MAGPGNSVSDAVPEEYGRLLALTEDDDPCTAEAVDRRMFEIGRPFLEYMVRLRETSRSPVPWNVLEGKILNLNGRLSLGDLNMQLGSGYPDLTACIYLVCRICDPYLPRHSMDSLFSPLVSAVLAEFTEYKTAVEKTEILSYVFFRRFSIVTSAGPGGLCLSVFDVLGRGCGYLLPLSVIYMMLARQTGMEIYPACNRLGFIPAYVRDGRAVFFINLPDRGRIMPVRLFDSLFADARRKGGRFLISTDTAVVRMYADVMRSYYASSGDAARSGLLAKAVDMIDLFL